MDALDDEAAADDIWLHGQVVRMLQRMIEPEIVGEASHVFAMARARRCLRRMGEVPISERTPLESRAAVCRVPVIGRIDGVWISAEGVIASDGSVTRKAE